MSYRIRTNLKCSNPELISKGSEFSINSKSEILDSQDREMHFFSRFGGMKDDIEELSKKYPDEIFTADMWIDDYYGSDVHTYQIISGVSECTKQRPGYGFSYKSNVDSVLVKPFMDKISAYLNNYFSTFESSVYEIPPIHDNELQEDGLHSYLTFAWETENHRFTGINRYDYLIEILYENKDKENVEKLRKDVTRLKEKLAEKDCSNDGLPF